MKNSIFARFARAFFIFWHFEDVLVLSTTWNDLFCSCVDDVSIWWQMFNFVLLCPKRWFQFNSRIVRTHFSSIMSLNNWKMIAETRSHIFRWRSRFRRRRVCLSSLVSKEGFTYSIALTDDFFGVVFVYFFKNKWDTVRATENLFDCSPYDPTEEMVADIFTRPATNRIIHLWPSRFRCRRHLWNSLIRDVLVCIRKSQMAFAHVPLLNK